MKVKEADILIVPGFRNSGPEHWQSRWQEKLSTARRVEQRSWEKPEREAWANAIEEAVNAAERPVVLVAHSLGVPATLLAIPTFQKVVAGAFLVAPPDVSDPNIRPKHFATFGPYALDRLPFPSITVASRNDSYCKLSTAEDLAAAWESLFIDAGDAGHIDTESGYGPWPEGLLAFANFLAKLKAE